MMLTGRTQRAHSVEYGEHRHADVGEDGEPHRSHSQGSHDEDGHLDADGKPDILTGNSQRTTGYRDGIGHLRRMVVDRKSVV